jgi:hypothetical protein
MGSSHQDPTAKHKQQNNLINNIIRHPQVLRVLQKAPTIKQDHQQQNKITLQKSLRTFNEAIP